MAENTLTPKEEQQEQSVPADVPMEDLSDVPMEDLADDLAKSLEETLTFEPEKKSKRGKIIRRVILWTVLLAIAIGIAYVVYALFFKPDPPAEFETAMAYYSSIENKVQGSGTVAAQETQNILGLAKGRVLQVLVAAGDTVEIGQPLFVIDDEEIVTELNEKQATLTQAQKDVGLIYEEIEGQNLKAPFTGKTIDVKVEKGDEVTKGQILATMADDSKMRLVAYYSTVYRDEIAVGQTARISIPRSTAEIVGVVDHIENITKITDQGTVLFEVEIVMDNPGTLTKGMTATAIIETPNGDAAPAEAATLKYNQEENIKAKTPGEITTLNMRDYYTFQEGEVLLRMVNENLESDLSAELKTLEAARKSYDTVAEQYKYYSPTAEIAGQVLDVRISVGDELTGSSDVVLYIADTTKMIMNISVDEMYVAQLQTGMPVTISASYDTGAIYEGLLTSVGMQAEVGQGMSTFPAKVEVLGAEGLYSGAWLDYTIVTGRVDNCLVVPSNAVKYVENGTVCFVRNVMDHHQIAELDEMTASQVPVGFTAVWVETGASDAMQIEITSGLQEMDEVATTAIQQNPYY